MKAEIRIVLMLITLMWSQVGHALEAGAPVIDLQSEATSAQPTTSDVLRDYLECALNRSKALASPSMSDNEAAEIGTSMCESFRRSLLTIVRANEADNGELYANDYVARAKLIIVKRVAEHLAVSRKATR